MRFLATLLMAAIICSRLPAVWGQAPVPRPGGDPPQAGGQPQASTAPAAPGQAIDAEALLKEVARAMAVESVNSIRYAGRGYHFALGENYLPEENWPRFRLERYSRFIDYEASASQEELLRTQAESPPRGGGNQPIVGVQRRVLSVQGDYAWNMSGNLSAVPEVPDGNFAVPVGDQQAATAAPEAAAERRLGIWLTPHGFVRAALQNHATAARERVGRNRVATVVRFTLLDRYQVSGTINDQNQVETVETHIENPVLGDMPVQFAYLSYSDFAGVAFPTHIIQSMGGAPTLEVTVSSVEVNPAAKLTVPAQARVATEPPIVVEAQPISEGLWFLTGSAYNSVAVEFRDYVALIEAPESERRSMAVLAKIHSLSPGKQVRYVVNTHHHFENAAGLRTYLADGATLITHGVNLRFFELAFASARTLNPDKLSLSGNPPNIQPVGESYAIQNGGRSMQIFHVDGNLHDGGLLMIYFPRERLLVEADAFTPLPPNAPAPETPNTFAQNLYENIQRLKLDVVQIAPIRGRMVPFSELLKALGKQKPPPAPQDFLRAQLALQSGRGVLRP